LTDCPVYAIIKTERERNRKEKTMKIRELPELTATQKAAFAAGDDYYESPFANRKLLWGEPSRRSAFAETSLKQIFEARADYKRSFCWD
jgi:hypothetical protein